MIEVEAAGRCFEGTWALRDVSFRVSPGAFLGILGRNGAGKTTLVRLLTGQLRPTEGRLRVAGLDVATRPLVLRRRMGVMPDATALLDRLGGDGYLRFVGRIHGLEPEVLEARIRELACLLDMDFSDGKAICDYSFGMRKKTALAAALLHGPELLFLDEPFEGLDPVSSATVAELLAILHAKGTTILLTSHLLGRAERLCDRFLVVDEGRILADGPASELLKGEDDLEGLFLRLVGRGTQGRLTWM